MRVDGGVGTKASCCLVNFPPVSLSAIKTPSICVLLFGFLLYGILEWMGSARRWGFKGAALAWLVPAVESQGGRRTLFLQASGDLFDLPHHAQHILAEDLFHIILTVPAPQQFCSERRKF